MASKRKEGSEVRDDYNAYAALRGLNWGTLREMGKSPLHFHTRLTVPLEDTKSMQIGRLFHTAILEPQLVDDVYCIWEGGRRGTNAYKEWLAECAAGREEVSREELETAQAAAASVWRHPAARRVLRGGKVEVSIQWVDPETHMRCKARPDHLRRSGALTDLKSTTTADSREFGRNAAKLGYHGQLGFYRRGLRVLGYPDAPVRIIAVEQKPPHDVLVYTIPDYVLDAGEQLAVKLMKEVQVWRKRGRWPGRAADEQPLQFPDWALPADDLAYDEIEVLS